MVLWWWSSWSNSRGGCRGGDDDGGGGVGASVVVEITMMMKMVVMWLSSVEREGETARGGEWYGGSGRSGDENRFWFRSEKSAGKVFRRRRGGGGRNPTVAVGRSERGGR
ncbi:hypothetical protein Tco_0252391 [Tanacetum coccineum]